jgi:hypothetical protein
MIKTQPMEEPVIESKKEKDKTERERQTFYRVAFQNYSNLLQIADNKANIIISINALVISSLIALVSYGSISNQLEMHQPVVFLPILIFLGLIMTSTLLAVQVAKPKIMGKSKDKAEKTQFSMLFFGATDFYSYEEYLVETHRVLHSRKEIQDQMTMSLYYQGKVLSRKYKVLRQAYTVFTLALAFGVVVLLGNMIL